MNFYLNTYYKQVHFQYIVQLIKMASKRSSAFILNHDLDQTFRFDSRASRPSRRSIELENQGESKRSSEVLRQVDKRNQNILDLHQVPQKVLGQQKGEKKEFWNYISRFEKESNPEILIEDIDVADTIKREPLLKQIYGKSEIKRITRKKEKSHESDELYEPYDPYQSYEPYEPNINNSYHEKQTEDELYHPNSESSSHQKSREKMQEKQIRQYPKRNRIPPVKYWKGQRALYNKNRQFIGIQKPEPRRRK